MASAVRVSGAILLATSISKLIDGKVLPMWLAKEYHIPSGSAAAIATTLNIAELLFGLILVFVPSRAALAGASVFALATGYHVAALILPNLKLCPCLGGLWVTVNPIVLHSTLLSVSAGACIVNVGLFALNERNPPCLVASIRPSLS